MATIKLENLSNVSFLGNELIKSIYAVASRLDANYVVVNMARYNKYAEIDLFNGNDCIDWGYPVSTN